MSEESSEREPSFGLAFVLVADTSAVEPKAVVEGGESLGVHLTYSSQGEATNAKKDDRSEVLTFEAEGGVTLMAAQINAPHPDVPEMFVGPTSPDRDQAIAAPAHIIVTVLGLHGDRMTRDAMTARLTAAVVAATPAVGAMLSHGVTFHHAGLFKEIVEQTPIGKQDILCAPHTVFTSTDRNDSGPSTWTRTTGIRCGQRYTR